MKLRGNRGTEGIRGFAVGTSIGGSPSGVRLVRVHGVEEERLGVS